MRDYLENLNSCRWYSHRCVCVLLHHHIASIFESTPMHWVWCFYSPVSSRSSIPLTPGRLETLRSTGLATWAKSA